MKFIQHNLKKLDFLGPTINFSIRGEKNFKTVSGGFISVTIYFLYLFLCMLFGRNLIYRLNPNVSLEKILPEEPENYTINNQTFFAWRITDFGLKNFNTSEFFDIQLSYEVYNNLNMETTDWKTFESISCKNSHYEKFFEHSIYKAEDWNCFDFQQIESRQVFGSWDEDEYSYILFQMQICDIEYDTDTKINCKDYRKVEDYLNKNSLFLTFLNYEVDFKANNYFNPLQRLLKTSFTNVNLNLQKTDYLKFQNTKVEQDDHILFSEERHLTNMYGINPLEELTYFRSNEDLERIYAATEHKVQENTYSLFIFNDNTYYQYSRKYQKIQDIFGNVNGFMKFVIAVLGILSFYTDYRLELYMFNKLVKVQHRAKKDDNNNTKNYNYKDFEKKSNYNFQNNGDLNFNNNQRSLKNSFKNDNNLSNKLNLNNDCNNNFEDVNEIMCSDNKTQNEINNKKNFSKEYEIFNAEKQVNKSYSHPKKPSIVNDKDFSSIRFNSDRGFEVDIEKIDLEILKDDYASNSAMLNKQIVFSQIENEKELDKIVDNLEIDIKDDKELNNIRVKSATNCLHADDNMVKNNNDNCVFLGNNIEHGNKNYDQNIIWNIDQLVYKKKRYLKPSYFDYIWILCCKPCYQNKKKSVYIKNKKYFDFKLHEVFCDKIFKKFDIVYYFKWIKNYKNLKKLVLENKANEKTFDVLARNFYYVKTDDDTCDFYRTNKKKKKINLNTLRNNIKKVFESDDLKFKQFLYDKLIEFQ